jgi:hypothetical protein
MITLAQAKAVFNSWTPQQGDAQIQRMIDTATATVEQYCNQPIVKKAKIFERAIDSNILYPYAIGAQPQVSSNLTVAHSGLVLKEEDAADGRLLIVLPFVAVPLSLTKAERRESVFDSYVDVTSDVSIVGHNGSPHLAYRHGFSGYGWRFTLNVGYVVSDEAVALPDYAMPYDLQQVAEQMLIVARRMDARSGGGNLFGITNQTRSAEGANISTAYTDPWLVWARTLDNYKAGSLSY